MQIAIRHELTLSLGAAGRAVQHLLLMPSPTPQQKVERWSIEMVGIEQAAQFRDCYGNRAHLVSQIRPDGDIIVVVSGRVETNDKAGVLGRLDGDPMPALFRRTVGGEKLEAALLTGLDTGGRIAALHELMGRLHAGREPARMQSQQTQSQSRGDMSPPALAGRFVAAARALEIPARYVTGYLVGDEHYPSGFHAWAEAWDEGLGWIGFDPSLNVCPAEGYVRLASGLDAVSTMPVRAVPAWSEMPVEVVSVVGG